MRGILDDIERQVHANPEHSAIINGSHIVTYLALDTWTDAIAADLTSQGLDPAKPVAYLGTNGINLIAAFLATQKAGYPFMPLNRKFPPSLAADFFMRSNSSICLTDLDDLKEAAFLPFQMLRRHPEQTNMVKPFQRPLTDEKSISVLQCSSGSTGQPKIIPYSRAMEQSYINIHREEYRLTAGDVVAHMDTFWVESPLAALSVGATLSCLDPAGEGLMPISDRMLSEKVSVMPVYPSFFRMFKDTKVHLPDLRLVMLSGEAITRNELEIFEALTQSGTVLLNCYASMEATWTASYRYQSSDRMPAQTLPAGKPVDQMMIRIVGDDGISLPAGEIGEIVIYSELLPSGYLGDPERSRRVFGADEFGMPTYVSGDFGYFDAKGDLHNVGRKDDQVRINGFNVRLSVIEAELLRHTKVKECAIVVKLGERQISRLHGFYVGDISADELNAYLGSGLPTYMIPKTLTNIEAFPKTVTGKVRRDKLNQMVPTLTEELRKPLSGAERKIASIWARVLDHHSFSVSDSFFDVGGDSLRAMEVLLDVELAFNKRISLDRFILSGGTIIGLVGLIAVQNDTRLRVLKAGRGKRSVYVTHLWDGGVSPYFDVAAAFDQNTEVIGITADYVGRSRSFSIEEKAAEAAQQLPNDTERVLVGYSYAALFALEIARLTPQTPTWLILIDPFSKPFRGFSKLRHWGALLEERYARKRPLGNERAYPGDHVYRPAPVKVERACLFYGNDFPQSALPQWAKTFDGQLDLFRHTGGHVSMMHGGGAIQIADQITNWLSDNSAR